MSYCSSPFVSLRNSVTSVWEGPVSQDPMESCHNNVKEGSFIYTGKLQSPSMLDCTKLSGSISARENCF